MCSVLDRCNHYTGYLFANDVSTNLKDDGMASRKANKAQLCAGRPFYNKTDSLTLGL